MNEAIKLAEMVLLECTQPTCPRKVKLNWDNTMPVGTVRIVNDCPWHGAEEHNGNFERYFDQNNKELFYERSN